MAHKHSFQHEKNEQKETRSFLERWMDRLTAYPSRKLGLKELNRRIRVTKRGRGKNILKLAQLEKSNKSEMAKYGDRKITQQLLGWNEDKLTALKTDKKSRRKPKKKSRETYYVR